MACSVNLAIINPIPSIKSKSVSIDIFAIDANGKAYDIEIQNRISDSIFKHARFHNDAKAEGKAECISIFMKETNCKIEDALKKFEIPEAEWDAYRKLIHD